MNEIEAIREVLKDLKRQARELRSLNQEKVPHSIGYAILCCKIADFELALKLRESETKEGEAK